LEDLGYRIPLPVVDASAPLPETPVGGMVDAAQSARPSANPTRSDLPWLVDARPAYARNTSRWTFRPFLPIPEPASVILFLTGVIGLTFRRLLERGRR
jgi:hypothetical protein